MKKYSLILILVFLIVSIGALAQTSGNFISATVEQGTQANSVYITIKSNTTITGAKFSTFQFAVGVAATTVPSPTATITATNANIAYDVPGISVETQSSSSFKVFSFIGDGSQSAGAAITYTAGSPYHVAEVFFSGGPITPSNVRIMQLANGGLGGNVFFYVADRGFDVTNKPAQFYSSIPANVSNDGAGYTGSSYAVTSVAALPIKLTNFTAIKKDKDALLTWSVENQDANASHFEIERSFNGTDFTNIGKVNVNLNTGSSATYNSTDVNIAALRSAGVIYYRIKQVDKDGKFSYSEIRSIKLDSKSVAINLYPNPAKSFTNILIDLPQNSPIVISINDAAGKEVKQINILGFTGINQTKIDLTSLSTGSYMVKVKAADQLQTISLVKSE